MTFLNIIHSANIQAKVDTCSCFYNTLKGKLYDKTSYAKASDSIKNKFPNELLPKDGKIINYIIRG